MSPRKIKQLKTYLEKTHQDFLESNEVQNDALAPALQFQNSQDKEFITFICSILAYGKVAQIKKSIHALVDPMEDSPTQWLINSSESKLQKHLKNWKHRFNTNHDMLIMLLILQKIYSKYESIENFIQPSKCQTQFDLLIGIHQKFYSLIPSNKKPKKSFHFFIPDPNLGSASKRMNLFLKWMVRDEEPDLGLWTTYSKKNLLIPLDTHIFKQAKSLGITNRGVADIQTSIEITNFFKKLDPSDPTRYDFALCHLGINGVVLS